MKKYYITIPLLKVFEQIGNLSNQPTDVLDKLKKFNLNDRDKKNLKFTLEILKKCTLPYPPTDYDVLKGKVKKLTFDNFTEDDLYDISLDYDGFKENNDSELFWRVYQAITVPPTKTTKQKTEDFPDIVIQKPTEQPKGSTKMIKFTHDFWQTLDMIDRKHEEITFELYNLSMNATLLNTLGVEEIDLSDKKWYFKIKQNGRWNYIKIGQFLRHFFGNRYSQDQIYKFTLNYNSIIDGIEEEIEAAKNYIEPRPFRYDPLNVRETFISLVTETYPMGHEEEVVPFITPGLTRDKHGNYYTIIGNSDTAFTCHLDTASRTKSKIRLVGFEKDGDQFIMSDGKTILGADDKSGVAVIMYMIARRVPGVYWFFMGEERGGIGSSKVANDMESYPFMANITKMVSFDRRNYHSVITSQMNTTCCSNEFADSLCAELNKSGLKLNLDPTGVFTDSANFIDSIPECTNVSVGYFNEHTHDEIQNISYLEKLAKACVEVDWDNLVVKRKIGVDSDIMAKYTRLIRKINRSDFFNKDSVKGEDGKLVIKLSIEDPDIENLHEDLVQLEEIFKAHKLDPDIIFDESSIKIELT